MSLVFFIFLKGIKFSNIQQQNFRYVKLNHTKMKPEKNLAIKKNILRHQQVLESFSLELDSHLNEIKCLKVKKQKKNQELSLPAIKQPGKSVHVKENWKIFDAEMKANELQLRLNRIEKNNQSFMDVKKYKPFFKSQSQSPRYPQPQLMIPPVQYIPFPIFNIFPPSYSNENSQYRNNPMYSNQTANSQQPRRSDNGVDRKEKISESRKNYLKRRLKIISFAIYFIFVYKTYFQTILYKKCLRFLQIQQMISLEYSGIENNAYEKLIQFNLFEKFYFLTRDIQAQAQSSKNLSVNFQDEEVKINIQASQQFVRDLLDQLHQSIKNGSLNSLNPILANLVQGGFPYSSFFLIEELRIFTLNQDYGFLLITPEISKMLIINFIFIKLIIFQLLGKKSLLGILYNFYKKKPEEKKFTLFYGKKLTITLILLYQALNSVFFSQSKKLNPNYEDLSPYLKVEPLQQLQYEFSLNKKQNNGKKKQYQIGLIKNVMCPQNLKSLFLNGFEQNWSKIKKISETLYEDALNYKFQLLGQIKKQISEEPFPKRQLLNDMLKFKYQRTKQLESQMLSSDFGKSQGSSIGEGQSIGSRKSDDQPSTKRYKKGN